MSVYRDETYVYWVYVLGDYKKEEEIIKIINKNRKEELEYIFINGRRFLRLGINGFGFLRWINLGYVVR